MTETRVREAHEAPVAPASPEGVRRRSTARRASVFRGRTISALGTTLVVLASCYTEPEDERRQNPGGGGTFADAGSAGSKADGGIEGGGATGRGGRPSQGEAGAGGEPAVGFSCLTPTAESLPARRSVTSPDAAMGSNGGKQTLRLTKEALFDEFKEQTCGNLGCHGGPDNPTAQSPTAFTMTLDSFDERPTLGTESLERVLSSDVTMVMPPGTGVGSGRGPNNPYRVLAERLLAWENAGFPESFEIEVEGEPEEPVPTEFPYLLAPELGESLTNIGSCIPEDTEMMSPVEDEMFDKDALFATLESSEDLPETLFETDLVSLDSEALARRAVFSYAPTYPLFSDHAGKMRYVRVPRGKTIRYNPETKDFDIPDNTRFYKTFLKEVRDADGVIGHRKMETRVIVVRQDEKLPDGTFRPRALRATYAWDKDEMMARRVKDPFRNGSPAADRLCPYITDESEPRDPVQNPISEPVNEYCEYMTEEELADPGSGRIRHYAIPSTERCDQCHMGSNNRSYILGFSPWQVDRRRPGEGGIYEDPKGDELSQMARLLSYGVISGIEPGEAKLEASQGERKPRNDHELVAQGYMIGNCAFCHNPNGFPVVQNPVLRAFELYPNETTGGVFQFPLEKFSPRAKGGSDQSVRIPYITAAFGDLDFTGVSGGTPKSKSREVIESPVVDGTKTTVDYDPISHVFTFLGPWRSLIWRNVYTPFTYEEDNTLFIHMPRNVAGFDCRAQKLMANWMLSIPTAPKVVDEGLSPQERQREHDQPVREVFEKDLGAAKWVGALNMARKRLEDYAESVTGSWCPDDEDIVDRRVLLAPIDPETKKPAFISPPDDGVTGTRVVPDYPYPQDLFDAVPDHAHFIPTDTTDPADRWYPRRSTWRQILATREAQAPGLEAVIEQLRTVHVSDEIERFALELLPMGPYDLRCQEDPRIAGEPSTSDLQSEGARPLHRWLKGGVFDDDSAAPHGKIHTQSRGEAVFRAICMNCHGRDADSKSPLAATILELSGGKTRVANFVDGLLGPRSAPGAFARGEFLIDLGATPDDWQARYVLFMGLGGTASEIPQVVLNLVATSPFYGAAVKAPGGDNPNMLGSAEKLCAAVLTQPRELPGRNPPAPWLTFSQFFAKRTAHYELWESLCTHRNEPVVHVFVVRSDLRGLTSSWDHVYRARDANGAWVFPSSARVGNQRGEFEQGISADNTFPWCIRAETAQEVEALQQWAGRAGVTESELPFCPTELFAEAFGHRIHKLALSDGGVLQNQEFGNQEFSTRWFRHGAINAGLVALEYLRGLAGGELEPSRPHDFCIQ